MKDSSSIGMLESVLSPFFSRGGLLEDICITNTFSMTVPGFWSISRRILNRYLYAVISEGNGRLLVHGREYELEEHTAYLIGPGVEHTISTDPECPLQLKTAHFTFENLPSVPVFVFLDMNLSYFRQVDDLMTFVTGFRAQPGNPFSLFSQRVSLLQALLLLRDFMEEQPGCSIGLAGVVNSLDPAGDYSIMELSEMAGYSEKAFIRKFRQVYGTTPHQYLIQRKISLARYLLAHSRMSIKEISASLHYRDQYLFSRQFKRFTGISPTGYRTEVDRG